MRICSATISATAVVAMLLSLSRIADAAEVKVIAANPLKAAVQQLGPEFERQTGHKLVTKFVTGPLVKEEIDAGAAFDLAIGPTPLIDGLVKDGKLVSRMDVAKIGVGLGVRADAPKPDLGSVEAFKELLLKAKSVAHSAQGESGVYFKSLLERLGIAEEMKPKLKPMAGDPLANAVPRGEAEMIVSSMPDVIVEGTIPIALPPELQKYINFAAGVSTKAVDTEPAKALVQFLTSPAAVPAMRAKGLEPGTSGAI